jgi:translation initiation factor 2D
MFKKKPQIKNLSPLRSSDRRKLADQIIAEYRVHVPTLQEIDTTASTPEIQASASSNNPSPALTLIRSSLVPETCLSARFTTLAGANATLVSGTLYVGAHPGYEERILWMQYGKDSKLYPTVYTLWHNPGLVPLLHTQDFVLDKLRTGADLMTPGLVGGPPWPEAAKVGVVVAVAGLEKDSVPIWVGTCKIDVSSLGRVQGAKGAAVEGVHWECDEIWSWSQTGVGGRQSPDRIEGWDSRAEDLGEAVHNMDLEDNDDDDESQDQGGVAIAPSQAQSKMNSLDANGSGAQDDASDPEPEHEPTTKEVDDAFLAALLYALYDAKKNGDPPHYGIDFPIQPSFLIANIIQPHLRVQNQHYNIKKTTWKNTKKFIKHLDKIQLVKSKDRNGGETVILDVDFNDEKIKSFTPYKLPKAKVQEGAHGSGESQSAVNGGDPSLGQKLAIQTIYRASSKLVPDLIPSKTTFYTAAQISSFLKKYIENNATTLTTGTSSPRFIKLDPFIANHILSSNPSSTDTRALAAGEIGRDVLLKRILEDDHLAIPHWLLLRNAQTYDPEHPDPGLKPKSGPSPHVTIMIEKRTGTKLVTKISGLELFGINPHILGPELQKKCAGSASVGQHVGGKPGMMEILVQGDQRDVVEKEMGRRGVDRRWIVVDDKTKKKKK